MGAPKGAHGQDLATALLDIGSEVVFVSPQKLTSLLPERQMLSPDPSGVQIDLMKLDALLIRSLPGGSLEQVIYRVDALHRLENLGLRIINRPGTLEKTVDKFYTSALLAESGLPVPQTVVTESVDQALEAVKSMKAVVVKPLFGSLGKGMVLVEDIEVAYRVLRALELGRSVYYLQKFLPHNNEDYRLLVVGGTVVSAMRRRGESWKTNIACGAVAEYIKPDPVLERLAVQTAEVLGADCAGVDILISDGEPYIIEANGIPGWSGLQSVSSVNIARVLAEYTINQVQLAERSEKADIYGRS